MKKRSITSQISVMIILFLIIGVVVAFVANGWLNARQFAHAYEERLNVETQVLSESLAGPVWSYNYAAAETIAQAFAAHGDVVYLKIMAAEQAVPVFELPAPADEEIYTAYQNIVYDGGVIGIVEVGLSSAPLMDHLIQSFFYTLGLLLVMCVIILIGIRISLNRLIETPISTLASWARQIAKGDYRAASEGAMNIKELAPVAEQIKIMSSEIERRENTLNAHIALEQTLSRIHQQCIAFRKWNQAYWELLRAAMSATESGSGLIAEVYKDEHGEQVLKVHAHMNISTDGDRDNILSRLCQPALASTLVTIANDRQEMPADLASAATDARIGTYLALPLLRGGETVGVLVLANRKEGYDQSICEYLDSLLRSSSSMITAIRDDYALRQSEDLTTAILEGALTGIITARTDGTILDCNPFALSIFKGRREDVIDKKIGDMFPSHEQKSEIQKALKTLRETGTSWVVGKTLHVQALRLDGTEFPAEVNVTLHKNRKLLTGVVRDLTDEKAAEHALRRAQKMEAIGQLTGGIAHDFTNILGIIIGNLEFLMRPELVGVDPKEHLDSAYKAAMRATQLTKRLLNFARQQPEHAATANVNEVINGMNNLISKSVTAQTTLECDLADDLWNAHLDSGELEDALLNMAINAGDAMPGGGTLTISTKNTVIDRDYARQNPPFKAGDYVEITTSDTGHGIDKENIDNIFEPFFSTKDRGKGTGLGLSMVFAFVTRSGGVIKAHSEKGIGTTFKIYLPRDTQDIVAVSEHTAEKTGIWFGTETVLVVDDEEDLVRLAKANLVNLGYKVLTAFDALSALDVLKDRPDVDLLFTDTVMPGPMNGQALADAALGLYPNLKVLITTGFATGISTDNGHHAGGQGPLSKPYTKSSLARRIRQELDSH